MEQNSFKAWIKASRPVTLTAAVAPVVVGLAIAWSDIRLFNDYLEAHNLQTATMRWIPAVLCMLFAIIMQIDANFINDYYDWKRGIDKSDRLGPKRACAEKWVTPKAMQQAIGITTLLGIIVGTPLIYFGGLTMLFIGIACVAFCFLYTTLLSRYAMGDILVVLFFGIIPVCTTYYLQTWGINLGMRLYGGLTYPVFYAAIAQGLVTDLLLIVNNYRDRETDKASGKHTLVVVAGETFTEVLYMMLGIIAVALLLPIQDYHHYTAVVAALFVLPHYLVWCKMREINKGRELNKVLGLTSLTILLFSVLVAVGVCI